MPPCNDILVRMKKVFLSSTARDLQEYRDAVFAAIQACDDLRCVRMEDFGARAEMADEFCRAKVAECDVFVGIVGHYFGNSPKGSDKSYTQQEYDAAVETDRPRLMFIAPDDFPIPANLVENASKRKRQREFRARVNGVLRAEFKSPQDLATKVVTAIRNWEREQEQVSMEQLRAQYLAHVIGEWEKIRLIGFSHAGKAVDDPKLEQVFVPLRVESVASRERFEEIGRDAIPLHPEGAIGMGAGKGAIELRPYEYEPRTKLAEKIDVNTALQVARKAVVLGAPGAGKSTLLQWLALSFARGAVGAQVRAQLNCAPTRAPTESRVPLRRTQWNCVPTLDAIELHPYQLRPDNQERIMPYNPDQHHRRSMRLQNWDYASAGAYFVTICVENRECVFGEIVDAEMRLNALGNIVAEYWQNLPHLFPAIVLDAFVVMPNHVHFAVWLNPPEDARVGAQLNCAPTNCAPTNCAPTNRASTTTTTTESPIGKRFTVDKQRPTLGQVVRALKAATTRLIRQSGSAGFAWQRNYYEHIVRDERELERIRKYILDNPANWAGDEENPNKAHAS